MAHQHNSTLSLPEPDWASVDKTRLPRIAHAEMGDPDKKSSWGYPHHWIKGGSKLDGNGVYTDGTMYLHNGGLNAAWAAVQGARSGRKASQSVISHLQSHRKALGKEEKEKAESEALIIDAEQRRDYWESIQHGRRVS